ncbi:hypothetical protein [Anabaena azotica]|uniref:Uncharacterized protein n=1 Tax=Anabaena azotica FACHB-119 TaxID=947527 RepID=A0ABR8D5S8_9NOST|nr:hypothetical protein [Anabaena azotica]MBD2501665.1 hypothetical protein [Anabaena azotica FACHB-119]
MIINIKLDNEENLIGDNASYSLGWIEIVDRAKEIYFFKDKLCMIFITITFLLEHIKTLETQKHLKLEWVGEDYGAVFNLSINSNQLCIEDKNISIFLNFQEFKMAVLESVRQFLKYCLEINIT